MPASQARVIAATTAEKDIRPGTPEEAFQAVNLAKMLWGFRLRDVDSWQEVIEKWTTNPPAWKRIPDEKNPYDSPRAMIEAELEVNYDQFKEFIRIVLGQKYAALIDEPLEKPGGKKNPEGHNQYSNGGHPHVHKGDQKSYGTGQEYLRRLILKERPEVLDEIGKGKKYKTVHEAARKTGLINVPDRYHIPSDPEAAARFLEKKVDKEWRLCLVDEIMKAIEE